jgi:ubiquinone biosynthesis protein
MEFINGIKINDLKGIENFGFDPKDVSQLLLDVFSQQIFVSGFLHW